MFWRKCPTGTLIVLADIEPPTWDEQQRLMGAMLAYHLARRLKFAGNNGTLRVSASPWTAKFFNDMINNNYSFLSLGKFWQIDYAIKRETTLLQQIRYPTYFVEGMCLAFIQWLFNYGSPDIGTSAMATPRPSLISLSEQEL
ncbi:hypothetical protein N7509_013363 [Penicillium cosmopolitanum]|uniref:Uncharacterized protein n=1 Tax=Penicillium cosmopolitanum TaxID=1131564 RepID=A0A9W9SD59_9EURO|nr:uncharacterized protein N7509_013363 [Penicillium cosmopolitanum]KAJ5376477.1 hypothetical protein N7509_013363 [Penicillium cosmopolitanum]